MVGATAVLVTGAAPRFFGWEAGGGARNQIGCMFLPVPGGPVGAVMARSGGGSLGMPWAACPTPASWLHSTITALPEEAVALEVDTGPAVVEGAEVGAAPAVSAVAGVDVVGGDVVPPVAAAGEAGQGEGSGPPRKTVSAGWRSRPAQR